MLYPQLVVYESDRRLATWLREAVDVAVKLRYDLDGKSKAQRPENEQPLSPGRCEKRATGWLLREARQPSACLRLFENGGPAVLVIQLTKDAASELDLLERTTRLYPDVSAIVIGNDDHRSLELLAWELGATAVLFPPRVGERLQEIVSGIMQSVTDELRVNVDGNANAEDQSQ